MNKLNNKVLIVLGSVLLIIGAILYYFWSSSFRVASVSPNPTPMSATQIEFRFSRQLDTKYNLKNVKISNDSVKGNFILENDSITFKPTDALPEGRLTFSFPGLMATTGERVDLEATVNVKYVPYNQLPKDEQKRQMQESDSFQGEFPITNGYVPYAAPTWKVEYALPSETGVDKLMLMVSPFIDRGTREPEVDYNNRLEDIRKEFESYITSNGFKLADYYILYVNPYLSKYDQAPAESPIGD